MPYISKLTNEGGVKSLNRYVSMLAGNTAYSTSFESIATVTVGAGGASNITFSSIPQTYQHLQIRCIDQQYYGANDWGYTALQFNGDTGANYSRHQIWGSGGGSVAAYATTGNYYAYAGFSALIAASAPRTQYFATNIIDILDYSSSNKYKTVRALGGADFNGSGGVGLISSLWPNTAAITSIVIPNINGTIQQNTSYALYGIKGS
jgi:hypothetical protein